MPASSVANCSRTLRSTGGALRGILPARAAGHDARAAASRPRPVTLGGLLPPMWFSTACASLQHLCCFSMSRHIASLCAMHVTVLACTFAVASQCPFHLSFPFVELLVALPTQAGAHRSTKSERRRFRCLVACRLPSDSHSRTRSSGSGSSSGSTAISFSDSAANWQAAFLRHYWGFWRAAIPGPITAGAYL